MNNILERPFSIEDVRTLCKTKQRFKVLARKGILHFEEDVFDKENGVAIVTEYDNGMCPSAWMSIDDAAHYLNHAPCLRFLPLRNF